MLLVLTSFSNATACCVHVHANIIAIVHNRFITNTHTHADELFAKLDPSRRAVVVPTVQASSRIRRSLAGADGEFMSLHESCTLGKSDLVQPTRVDPVACCYVKFVFAFFFLSLFFLGKLYEP